MIEMTLLDIRDGEAHMVIDGQDEGTVTFTVSKGKTEYIFQLSRYEWDNVKVYIDAEIEFYRPVGKSPDRDPFAAQDKDYSKLPPPSKPDTRHG